MSPVIRMAGTWAPRCDCSRPITAALVGPAAAGHASRTALAVPIGLVMIYRLDLAAEIAAANRGIDPPTPQATLQLVWTAVALVFFLISTVFVWRSFYAMRIPDVEMK